MPQFLRYLAVGLACAGLEYGSFLGLHHALAWGLVAANTLAYALGLASSFLINKFWVFQGHQQHQTRYQFIAYCTLAFFNYSVGTGLLLYLAQNLNLSAWLAKILSMGAIVVWNFAIYKKLIYR